MAATPEPRSLTATGVDWPVVLPSPNWPWPLLPQQRTAPAVVSAQLWKTPAAMAATPEPRPLTATGVDWFAVLPSPNWPSLLRPQQRTAPAVVRAQVCSPPAAMAATPEPRPLTATGVDWSVKLPSPNWPE